MDGQTPGGVGCESPEGGDLGGRSGSDAWAHGRGGRRLAREVSVGAENALRSRPRDEEALKDEQIKKLKQKIGDLELANDLLREALKPYPLDRKTSDA